MKKSFFKLSGFAAEPSMLCPYSACVNLSEGAQISLYSSTEEDILCTYNLIFLPRYNLCLEKGQAAHGISEIAERI
jgi:hypothetical protein